MVYDTVHHEYPGSCPSVLHGFPAESTDHLSGNAGDLLVRNSKCCRPPLDSFQFLDVYLCGGPMMC